MLQQFPQCCPRMFLYCRLCLSPAEKLFFLPSTTAQQMHSSWRLSGRPLASFSDADMFPLSLEGRGPR